MEPRLALVKAMSIKQLAHNSRTSEASVLRFCKTLGYRGYRDFILSLSAALEMCIRDRFTMNLGTAIMLEASMSYLGVGITPPTPAWGSMVSEGYKYLLTNPAIAILPGICVLLVVISFNIVGDSLRDALDPRLRGKL